MIDRTNGRLVLLLTTLGLLVVLLLGWFLLVSPQRSKAASLDGQIGDTSGQLAATDAFLHSPAAHQSVAELRRLRVALPDDAQMSQIVRQLAWASRRSGVRITSLTPSATVAAAGAQALPIAVTVNGHYFRLAKFMRLLRGEAGVVDGKAHASGRLYAIDNISFSSSGRSGLITATFGLDAFVNGAAPAAAPATTTTEP
jgi:hypothetical protein